MASFDHTIPPGGEGKITLKVNTKGYEGKIYKGALVNTNDHEHNAVHLGIKAFVKVPVSVSPRVMSASVVKQAKASSGLSRSRLD